MKASRVPRHRGFTLVELLIVMTIIAVLIAILVAVARPDRDKVQWWKTVETLDQALLAYRNVYNGEYPPSNSSVLGSGRGAESLYYHLMGPTDNGWDVDNGVKPIYRFSPPKQLITEATVGGGENGSRKYFTDGNRSEPMPVLYYCANVKKTQKAVTGADKKVSMVEEREAVTYDKIYRFADNSTRMSDSSLFANRIRDPGSTSGQAPYRPDDYILWGAGADREFGTVDDFTNIVTQQ